MICPQCQAEYRDGFTVCADCNVPLVPKLAAPHDSSSASEPAEDENQNFGSDEEDPFCAFWEGEDTRIFAEVCTVLDEADIRYRSLRHDSQIFRISPYSKMKIGVPFSQFEKAELAVVEAFGGTTETKKLLWPAEEHRPEYTALVGLPFEDKWQDDRTLALNPPRASDLGEAPTDEITESASDAFERLLPDDASGNLYCPLCAAEYREGFTTCSDCRVPLVATRSEARSSRARLWKGDHQRELDLVLRELDANQIPAHRKEIVNATSRLRIGNIPIVPNRSAFKYEVWVFRRDLEKARSAIQSVVPQDLDD